MEILWEEGTEEEQHTGGGGSWDYALGWVHLYLELPLYSINVK
jgi:hypothetical protein